MTLVCLWFILSTLSSILALGAAAQLVHNYTLIHPIPVAIISDGLFTIRFIAQVCLYVVFRHKPPQLIGPFVRSAIHVVSVLAAAIVGHYCMGNPRNGPIFVLLLVMGTIDLNSLAQLTRPAADISLVDVLLGALMQVAMVYLAARDMYALIGGIISCGFLILYRHRSYSLPSFYNSIVDCSSESGEEVAAGEVVAAC